MAECRNFTSGAIEVLRFELQPRVISSDHQHHLTGCVTEAPNPQTQPPVRQVSQQHTLGQYNVITVGWVGGWGVSVWLGFCVTNSDQENQ